MIGKFVRLWNKFERLIFIEIMKFGIIGLISLILILTSCDEDNSGKKAEDYCIIRTAENGMILGTYGTDCENIDTWVDTDGFNISPVFPCPFQDRFTIFIELFLSSTIEMEIFDLYGTKVWEWESNSSQLVQGNHSFAFDANEIFYENGNEAGVYKLVFTVYQNERKPYRSFGFIEYKL